MSIATEITRIQGAKADIKSAIEAKGVTVPSNALIDDYDTYIGQISGGGGGNADLINLIERDITSIDIPSGTTTIGTYAFHTCTSLTSVTIPNTVTTIDFGSFSNTGLTSVTIPDSVTTINENAFYGNNYLTSATIGSGVTYIGAYVFSHSPNLTGITIYATTPPTLYGANAFEYTNNCPIYVPAASVNAYKAANNWSSLASRIQAIPSAETKVVAVFEVESTSSPTTLMYQNTASQIASMEIDGVAQQNPVYSYTFSTTGPHTVKYELVDNTTISWFLSDCTELMSVTLPNTVTSIGDYAFYACEGLQTITIPGSVTSIGQNAFKNCYSLETNTLPNSVTSIGDYAFYACGSFVSFTIPNSVTSIPMNAFQNCGALQTVSIGSSVTSIGGQAFQGCDLLSVTIPNSVTTISGSAFKNNYNLDTVVIGTGVTSIGTEVFDGCPLTSVTINSNTLASATYTNDNTLGGLFNSTGYSFGSNITTIGAKAFRYDSYVTSIDFTGITTIGDEAFYYSSLDHIYLPDVTTIGNAAFGQCRGLTDVGIGENITSIGNMGFNSASSLMYVTIDATTPPSLGTAVFEGNASGRTIEVPSESVTAYQTASGWSRYASSIISA